MKNLKISEDCIRLIIRFETWQKTAYDDGYGYKTIGVGHTKTKYKKGATITDEEVWRLFVADLKACEAVVEKHVKVALQQHEYDALVSFVFNVGSGNFSKSTLLKLVNQNKKIEAVGQFARWRMSAGKVSNGLIRRRSDEAKMFAGEDIFV